MHVLSTHPGMLSGPAALLMFTLSRALLKSAVETDSGHSSGGRVDLTADSLWRRSKRDQSCYVQLAMCLRGHALSKLGTVAPSRSFR